MLDLADFGVLGRLGVRGRASGCRGLHPLGDLLGFDFVCLHCFAESLGDLVESCICWVRESASGWLVELPQFVQFCVYVLEVLQQLQDF